MEGKSLQPGMTSAGNSKNPDILSLDKFCIQREIKFEYPYQSEY